MKKRGEAGSIKKREYPEESAGSRAARKIREQANKLTKEEREALFEQAMQVYYGGAWPKEANRP